MLIILRFCSILFFVYSSFSIQSSLVHEMNNDFRVVRYQGKWLVLFYTPWCTQCNELLLFWEDLAEQFSFSDLKIAKLNVNTFRKSSKVIGILFTPTIIFYDNGLEYQLKGEISRLTINRFVDNLNNALLNEIDDDANLTTLTTMYKMQTFYICVYNRTIDTRIHSIYTQAAIELKYKSKFFFTKNHSLFSVVESYPYFVAFKNGIKIIYDGIISVSQLNFWIKEESYSQFQTITLSDLPDIISISKRKYISIFVFENDSFISQEWNKSIHMLHNNIDCFDGLFAFFYSYSCSIISKVMGICPKLPKFVVWNISDLSYYDYEIFILNNDAMNESFNFKTMKQFLHMVRKKEIIPISGYSYWYVLSSIYADLYAAQMGIYYSHPILCAVFCIIFLIFFCVLCYKMFKTIIFKYLDHDYKYYVQKKKKK